jgi:hypothetical protein
VAFSEWKPLHLPPELDPSVSTGLANPACRPLLRLALGERPFQIEKFLRDHPGCRTTYRYKTSPLTGELSADTPGMYELHIETLQSEYRAQFTQASRLSLLAAVISFALLWASGLALAALCRRGDRRLQLP